MIIGVPKEIKNLEFRVALSPIGATELVKNGHKVLIEKNAGIGSGFMDDDYIKSGAIIVGTPLEIYNQSELIVKVKEPLKSEYPFIKEGQIIFAYLHLASSLELTEALLESKSICIAYETVQKTDKSLPLLIPMSEIAGKMAIQHGAKFLEKNNGGKGILMGGVAGLVPPAQVLILGAGIVGTNAALIAAGMGAKVTIMDINVSKLRQLNEWLPKNISTMVSNEQNILNALKDVDLVVGAVLIAGGKAPLLITRAMLTLIKKGTVLIDVAVDQGGCIESCVPTSHENPTYELDGIIHYGVPNMPGAVPYTATLALTTCTLPYILKIANKGWEKACDEHQELAYGLNIINGNIVYEPIAKTFGKKFQPWIANTIQ
ncbi:MAG: alanine dehydrogenase [Cytophagales bacterium]|nr:MAG: alanine dehydrogenase [Cytophagales bacterium]